MRCRPKWILAKARKETSGGGPADSVPQNALDVAGTPTPRSAGLGCITAAQNSARPPAVDTHRTHMACSDSSRDPRLLLQLGGGAVVAKVGDGLGQSDVFEAVEYFGGRSWRVLELRRDAVHGFQDVVFEAGVE